MWSGNKVSRVHCECLSSVSCTTCSPVVILANEQPRSLSPLLQHDYCSRLPQVTSIVQTVWVELRMVCYQNSLFLNVAMATTPLVFTGRQA